MPSTTIRLSRQLHERLAQRAKADHLTLAGAIERALDVEENAEFWSRAAETMGSADSRPMTPAVSSDLAGTLKDGLDPDESWDDVW
ncbi:MAG: hypothetical protein ACRCSN_02720 [Dermatophilaceae bacterium]